MTDEELLRRLGDMAERHGQELFPIATEEQLVESEGLLGYPLPSFLRRVYREVCNGGIGLGEKWRDCWLMGVVGGCGNDWEINAIEEYVERRNGNWTEDSTFEWPPGLLPVTHHGCAVYTCVDCTSSAGELVTFDLTYSEEWRVAPASFKRDDCTIRDWLESWLGDDGCCEREREAGE